MSGINVINLAEKFKLFQSHWDPHIIGELNGQYVKLAKLKGEFVWHSHEHEDELFMVVKGVLKIALRDKELILNEGDIAIIPKDVEHKPVADQEVEVLLFEPKSTVNTGEERNEKTKEVLKHI